MGNIGPDFSAPFFAPLYTIVGILLALLIVGSIGAMIWGAIKWMVGGTGNHQARSDGLKQMGIALLGLVIGLSAGSLVDWAKVLVF